MTAPRDQFVREYAGVFVESDPLDVVADELWAQYDRNTEAFDQAICQFKNERGVAMPVHEDERRACNANARRCRDEMLRDAVRRGVTDDHLQRAKRRRR